MTTRSASAGSSRYLDVLSAPGLWLGALTVFGAVVRWFVARDEGLWRDEGLFLAIVRLPRWQDTLEFLQFHESHPPLFYAIVRLWRQLAGDTDQAALLLVLIIGSLIVPATYFAASRLYSRRVGAIAAVLAAISPILIDHATMVRPYPLLQILLLASCLSLALALETATIKWWIVFGVSILAMLYTHNWAWLLAAGHAVAFAVFVLRKPRERARQMFQGVVVAILIALAYAPWANSLLYQTAHAGYSPLAVDAWNYILISPLALQASILPPVGTSYQRLLATFGELSYMFCAGLLWLVRRALRLSQNSASPAVPAWEPVARTGTRVLTATIATSLLLALVLSTRSNLVQPRCLSIFAPVGLVALVAAADHAWRTAGHGVVKIGLALGALAILSVYGGGVVKLLTLHKSNARELANAIAARSHPSDLVILMPEWLASSFNLYFKPNNDQIDYPREGRQLAVDFADQLPRLRDSASLVRTIERVTKARAQGRRVWLVSERIGTISRNLTKPIDFMKPPDSIVVHIRLQQVRNALTLLYGSPDTTLARGKSKDRYEHLIAALFTPAPMDSGAMRPPK
ncbi:MAG TPA: glycosyltransferase family 39 protein [Gemmatimonadaceae bacterium]|nr:glycosyltransferase family 39 protein [Gemmatimonadaceae bacterium]